MRLWRPDEKSYREGINEPDGPRIAQRGRFQPYFCKRMTADGIERISSDCAPNKVDFSTIVVVFPPWAEDRPVSTLFLTCRFTSGTKPTFESLAVVT